jgi:hypothetical protein
MLLGGSDRTSFRVVRTDQVDQCADIWQRLAQRRARGELNPEVWPPLVDEERFDVGPHDDGPLLPLTPAPDGLTIDDLD